MIDGAFAETIRVPATTQLSAGIFQFFVWLAVWWDFKFSFGHHAAPG